MNQLSWLLYAADVVGGLGGLATFLSIASGIAFSLVACFRVGIIIQVLDYGKTTPEGITKLVSKTHKWTAAMFGLATLFAVLTPNKETVHAIAASEMGERIVTSPTADKAMQALNNWLDEQISGDEGKPDREPEQGK